MYLGREIRNGGLEQDILEAVKEIQGLSEKDKARLEYLKSLPQNRYELKGEDGETEIIPL